MKKNIYLSVVLFSVLLLTGVSCLAKTASEQKFTKNLSQKIEQADNRQQIGSFVEQLAQKNPSQVAQLLLQGKFAYVHNESIIYIGVKGIDEVLVICQIDDFEVGTFYYAVHKKGNRVFEQSPATAPTTQGFATVFKREAAK